MSLAQGNKHTDPAEDEDWNVFARFNEIQSMTLKDIKETVYTKAIKNYKEK